MEQIKNKHITLPNLFVFIIPVIFGFLLAWYFKILYLLPFQQTLLFLAGNFVYFYIPGNLLHRYLHFHEDEHFIKFIHSLALGTALVPLLYQITRWISYPILIYPFGLIIFVIWFYKGIKEYKAFDGKLKISLQEILSCSFLVGIILVFLHFTHFTDIRLNENFTDIRRYFNETIFHLGIVNVLRDVFPPFYPYASGYSFSHYHLNMHLEIEMFHRIFSIDTLQLTYFYFPFLYFLLLVFVPFIFFKKYTGFRFPGVLTGILLFGSDLSFIPALLGIVPHDFPWTFIFNTTIWSLFTMNGYLPALFVVFLSFIYLKEFDLSGKLSSILMFGFLIYAAYGFKSTIGYHVIAATFLTGTVSLVLFEDKKKSFMLCSVSVLIAVLMALDLMIMREGTGNIIVTFEPFNNFARSLNLFGLSGVRWYFYPLLFLLYLVATFGARSISFYLLKDTIQKKNSDLIILFLSIFVFSGFITSEMINIRSQGLLTNNAYWFSTQALIVCWLLVPYLLLKLAKFKKRYLLSAILIIVISFPTTIQFLTLRFNNIYHTMNSDDMEIVRHFRSTPAHSVILHPLNDRIPSLSSNFAGRSSVCNIFFSFLEDNIPSSEAKMRRRDVEFFFDQTSPINKSSILYKYRVDYVYAPLNSVAILDREPSLVKILSNSKYVLYKVNL